MDEVHNAEVPQGDPDEPTVRVRSEQQWQARRDAFAHACQDIVNPRNAMLSIVHELLDVFARHNLGAQYAEDLRELRRLHVAVHEDSVACRAAADLFAARVWARRFPWFPLEDHIPHGIATALRQACELPAEEWLPICAHGAYDLLEFTSAQPRRVFDVLQRWRS